MTDEEYEEQVRRVEVCFAYWQHLLLHSDWRVKYLFQREAVEDDRGWEWVMHAEIAPEYMQAQITVMVPGVINSNDEELHDHVIHELLHLPVHQLRNAPRNTSHLVEERAVSELARAVRRVYDFAKSVEEL